MDFTSEKPVVLMPAAALILIASASFSCSRMPAPSYPNPPSDILASDGMYDDRISVTWLPVPGAARYTVYRSEHFEGPYKKAADADAPLFSDTEIEKRKTYFYEVSAVDRDGAEGSCGDIDSGYADNVAHVIGLDASDGSDAAGVFLSWRFEGLSGASYKVFRSPAPDGDYVQIAQPSHLSYKDEAAEQGRPYYYKVQAVNAADEAGPLSNVDSGYASLGAPVIAISKGQSSLMIRIEWTPVPFAASYHMFRSQSSKGPFILIASPLSSPYADAAVLGENLAKDFYYRVAAVSAYGVVGPESTIDYGYADSGFPSGFSATDGTLFSVRLTWHAVTNASSYRVYRLNGSSYALLAATSDCFYSDSEVSPDVPYSYKVSAVCGGHESALSDAVIGIAKRSSSAVKYKITWNANRQKAVNSDGGGYRIHYSARNDFSVELVKDVPYAGGDHSPASAVLAFNPDQKGVWYVRVSAYSARNGGKESPASSGITLKVE